MNTATITHVYNLRECAVPLPCQACGCSAVFATVAPSGQRTTQSILRCCQCGQERRDLAALDNVTPLIKKYGL